MKTLARPFRALPRSCGCGAATALTVAFMTCGCAPIPVLNSDLNDQELRAGLDGNFKPGMSVEQVQERLDELHVARRLRRVYPGPPVQLLARLFPVGGFWVDDGEYQETRYVDAWFVFGRAGLDRVDTEKKRMRIEHREYIDPPFATPELLPVAPRRIGETPEGGKGAHADQQ